MEAADLRQDVRTLIDRRATPCLSLYMPVHHAQPDFQQNRILFKNLLAEAEERLPLYGVDHDDAARWLAPARRLEDENAFGEQSGQGLALYLAPDFIHHRQLPLAMPARVDVGPEFEVLPILPLVNEEETFLLLELAQRHVALLEGTRLGFRQVLLHKTPEDLQSALGYDNMEKQLRYHTGTTSNPRGRRQAMFHGQGQSADVHKEQLRQFCRLVDKEIADKLGVRRPPLIPAGVEYVLSIFREVSSYPALVEQSIIGNAVAASRRDLHAQAWSILGGRFVEARHREAERFTSLEGTGHTAGGVKECLGRAAEGRVDCLFASTDVQHWGKVNPETLEVSVHEQQQAGDSELVNLTAVETLRRGGTVYAVPAAEMPNTATDGAVAILRY